MMGDPSLPADFFCQGHTVQGSTDLYLYGRTVLLRSQAFYPPYYNASGDLNIIIGKERGYQRLGLRVRDKGLGIPLELGARANRRARARNSVGPYKSVQASKGW